MEIPVIDLPEDLHWLNTVTSRVYYNALWATLVELKPKYCLEIGTFQYYSAKVFSEYFSLYMPDGVLITADISEWNRDKIPPQRVVPVMIYPHRLDIDGFHGGINIYHKNYRKVLDGHKNSCIINSILLSEEMSRYNIDFFDFTFVDAGHDEISANADLQIAKVLTSPKGWILIDDITNSDHELSKLYPKMKEKNSFYEYDNWPNPSSVDMALIKAKDFSLCL